MKNAFPESYGPNLPSKPGMTLRDWFAGMVIQGMIANPRLFDEVQALKNTLINVNDFTAEQAQCYENALYSQAAYGIADAMVKASGHERDESSDE